MESARGEVEAECAMNGQSDLTSIGETDGVVKHTHKEKGNNKR